MKAFWASLCQHPIALFVQAFAAFSIAWTITDSLNHFFGWTSLKSPEWFVAIIFCSVAYSILEVVKPRRAVIKPPMSDVSVEIVFGDIFAQDGVAVVPVNDFFDSEIGLPVSANSLHGIFLQCYFSGQEKAFDQQTSKALANVTHEDVKRKQGKSKRFSIGTTAVVEVAEHRYLIFALAKTDVTTCKAHADVPQMFIALAELWRTARVKLGGEVLNVPLIGSGLSGVGLPARDLVNIIFLSFLEENKRQKITHKLRIVLSWSRIAEVDLREIKKYWRIN